MLWAGGTQQGAQGRAEMCLVCLVFGFFKQKQRGLHCQRPFSDWGTKADNFLPFINTPNRQSLESVGLSDPGGETARSPRGAAALVGQPKPPVNSPETQTASDTRLGIAIAYQVLIWVWISFIQPSLKHLFPYVFLKACKPPRASLCLGQGCWDRTRSPPPLRQHFSFPNGLSWEGLFLLVF